MRPTDRRSALLKWDAQIAAAYTSRVADESPTLEPCQITLQRDCTRNLNLVAADIAVRSSGEMAEPLEALNSAAMRDAALGVAIGHYVAVLPSPSRRDRDGGIAERILAALVYRRDPELRRQLVSLTVALPPGPLAELDAEVKRVLGETDLTDLEDWAGDFGADVRSSVIEAIASEWMHQRAGAFGTRLERSLARRAACHRP